EPPGSLGVVAGEHQSSEQIGCKRIVLAGRGRKPFLSGEIVLRESPIQIKTAEQPWGKRITPICGFAIPTRGVMWAGGNSCRRIVEKTEHNLRGRIALIGGAAEVFPGHSTVAGIGLPRECVHSGVEQLLRGRVERRTLRAHDTA